jgi:hypothetical protein
MGKDAVDGTGELGQQRSREQGFSASRQWPHCYRGH